MANVAIKETASDLLFTVPFVAGAVLYDRARGKEVDWKFLGGIYALTGAVLYAVHVKKVR